MGAERRASPRTVVSLPPGLRLGVPDAAGRTRSIMAKLIDISDTGVGIEAFVRIESGALVSLEGDLRSQELSFKINGLARVAHVSEIEAGRFKIGLQFVEVALARPA
ncbi:MAG: PilZ domain-containing protein [Bryobacterales bacterium]|nr:PilZ domain-containing protein [Bryobacterales bacterium]